MPRFAANLSMLYPELAFLDRFEAAARDGFEGVEYLFPYDWEPAELAARLEAHGLQQVLFNAPPGGGGRREAIAQAWAAGDKGLACVPGREAEFREGLALALRYAQALACPRVHVMAGLVPAGDTREGVRATYVANLRRAARQAAQAGVALLVEPINTRDIPGFFLNRQDHAHELIGEIGEPNVQVQMDLYHCQIVEGDVAMKIRQYLPTGRVGHFQIAGVPQRHEPDLGELHHPYLFGVIDEVATQCGWQGWVGCEYRPARGAVAGGTTAGLGWLRAARAASPASS
ncbi:2-oxo-tetronate isomerase [Ramlibacter tataouinensis]|uniref:Candidate hydroxypyruvate isomerase n=1 Tax=Ramlibacter tataouinensis (strain ATCC BAA-407 / DSM 14655 / LMG 21543 / TTB310) TaxID=365046 RepID=F5Y335_RAMTT|nr:2-oxo-tetronate isomerase [Ramlibacter tataouinensis]AEG94915.1 candidate hydroxypyruvate isomerase [Ramlibacter tataouinensis TTB310]